MQQNVRFEERVRLERKVVRRNAQLVPLTRSGLNLRKQEHTL